jgi:E3 ubiquitin-protein ligase TRIP12
MIDSCPPTASVVVANQGVSLLIEKLLNIEFIDLAEQCVHCLFLLSETHAIVLLKQGVLSASLMFFDFFGIHVQKDVIKMAVNLCKRIPNDNFDAIQTVIPNLTNLLSYDDETSFKKN